MILFKDLDIQDDEIMQRKIKRQKIDINGKQNSIIVSLLYLSKFINHMMIHFL
jgi:hypothetical protein